MTRPVPAPAADPPTADASAAPQVVSLCLYRFGPWRHRLWALAQMGLARWPLARMPDLEFFKLMGAGTGEGFTPWPDTGAVAVLTAWPDLATAERRIATAQVFRRWRARAAECLVLHLEPVSVRGRWAGRTPFRAGAAAPGGPVAALTRATIRPRALLAFWRQAPAVSRRIGRDRAVRFKIGVGEVPWLHQVTFSIWPDTASMDAFARASGPHAAAIAAVRAEGWFSEELYARFAVRAHAGTWGGADPLAGAAVPLAAE